MPSFLSGNCCRANQSASRSPGYVSERQLERRTLLLNMYMPLEDATGTSQNGLQRCRKPAGGPAGMVLAHVIQLQAALLQLWCQFPWLQLHAMRCAHAVLLPLPARKYMMSAQQLLPAQPR